MAHLVKQCDIPKESNTSYLACQICSLLYRPSAHAEKRRHKSRMDSCDHSDPGRKNSKQSGEAKTRLLPPLLSHQASANARIDRRPCCWELRQQGDGHFDLSYRVAYMNGGLNITCCSATVNIKVVNGRFGSAWRCRTSLRNAFLSSAS